MKKRTRQWHIYIFGSCEWHLHFCWTSYTFCVLYELPFFWCHTPSMVLLQAAPWQAMFHTINLFFARLYPVEYFFNIWSMQSPIHTAVSHYWWARYPAACHWPVEENSFERATGPTGKIALEKFELQSWEREKVSGVDFLAVIPFTY